MREECFWHLSHFLTKHFESCFIVGQNYPARKALLAKVHVPAWAPQQPLCISGRTWIPSSVHKHRSKGVCIGSFVEGAPLHQKMGGSCFESGSFPPVIWEMTFFYPSDDRNSPIFA
ncbi:UNVERIFIED_CONTAM: hypothetical protein Slati_0471000 [Sesamum latifolium]|uniref:Uncharacterized protein n=1 Tax=Sesamum latifolium TaxID=2727402 RepID=A0AAW2XY15_9LAMI